eukprot:TRINITY_DN7685_c0_g1_i1.p1 TRINITY_DN7685_c0_g1~~TRINITY_DN7685_c0_g1_i1.p1  ORF type:complete len:118 (-),score=18.71 TRINITY_DN7685_c0_g1_i1:39-392(-)
MNLGSSPNRMHQMVEYSKNQCRVCPCEFELELLTAQPTIIKVLNHASTLQNLSLVMNQQQQQQQVQSILTNLKCFPSIMKPSWNFQKVLIVPFNFVVVCERLSALQSLVKKNVEGAE